jgi:hypothetical protein
MIYRTIYGIFSLISKKIYIKNGGSFEREKEEIKKGDFGILSML